MTHTRALRVVSDEADLKKLVVLTASDGDHDVMAAFLDALERYADESGKAIVWRVVDAIKAYEQVPPGLRAAIGSVQLDWIEPEGPLSHADAIIYGFSFSRDERVLMMSPDMVANIKDIPYFFDAMKGGAEIVAGWRSSRSGVSITRKTLTTIFNVIAKVIFRLPVRDFNTCMALVSPRAVDCILSAPVDCPSPPLYLACKLRDRISEVPIKVYEIPGKKSAYTVKTRLFVGIGRLKEIFAFIKWVAARGEKYDRR